jgi:hypothetical protein
MISQEKGLVVDIGGFQLWLNQILELDVRRMAQIATPRDLPDLTSSIEGKLDWMKGLLELHREVERSLW